MARHHTVLGAVLLGLLPAIAAGCGESSEASGENKPPPNTLYSCVETCEALQTCGAITSEATCASLCDTLDGQGAFTADCLSCAAQSCSESGQCLSPGSEACGDPRVQFIIAIDGLPPGTQTYAQISPWLGGATPIFSARTASENGTAVVDFGHAVHAGFNYLVEYYADINDNRNCDEGDKRERTKIYVDTANPVVYQLSFNPEPLDPQAPDICESFPRQETLCDERCEAAAECGAADGDSLCLAECEAAPLEATVACAQCMAERSCSDQEIACRQPGGVCRRDYVPPDGSLLAFVDGDPNDAGTPAWAQVRNAGGRVVATSAPVDVNEFGGFLLTFGQTVWRGQNYQVEYYVDRDGSSTCSALEPAGTFSVEFPSDMVSVYAMPTAETISPITCAQYNE